MSTQASWKQDLSASAHRISAGVVGGFLAGAMIGGIGGRLAMFVLRLTSDPSLRGLKTNDDFTIGRLSGDTVFLILFTAFLGILGALLYMIVRPWIPARLRPSTMGVVGGIVGGSVFIDPDGIDFTRLEPLPLAVAMFVALPALYGMAMSVLVDRFLRPESAVQRSRAWFVGLILLIPILLFGLVGLIVVVVMAGAWAISRTAPQAASLWGSTPVVWIGRAGLATGTGLALVGLVDDIGQIL